MSLVGKPAPDFALEGYANGDFKSYKLSDYKGKWVLLLFYPLDFTFVCPTEVLSFSKHHGEFAERNCQIFGVSVDSKFTHKAWVETDKAAGGLGGKLAYPLLADLSKKMSRDYGVLHDDAVALRGLFLINPEGVIVHEVTNFLPVGRSAAEALRTLKAFQYIALHGDEVCPADWEEGKATMKANPKGMAEYLSRNA
jgi:peroxiredoxin (alkyl hydroperoxide reductase subunit C)